MIIDLHAHYPTQLTPDSLLAHMTNPHRPTLGDRIRAGILRLANRVAGYQTPAGPGVTIPNLRAGNVRVALSVLLCPFSEIDLEKPYAAPPGPGYFTDLKDLLLEVEQHIATGFPNEAVVAHNHVELDGALAAGKVALIHAVEGGIYAGDTVQAVDAKVHELATLGVAYITIAHLFWRRVATNAAALPFLPDGLYHLLFRQTSEGLSDLGVALIKAMVRERILIDVTHMNDDSARETFELLDSVDPQKRVPVVATHAACHFSKLEYNIPDWQIKKIAERQGVIGLIVCRHFMAAGTAIPKPKTFDESIQIVCAHIERIRDVAGGSYDYIAFGSDLDGFIRPTLPGLESPAAFSLVEQRLAAKYSVPVAQKICSENAMRVLGYWKGRV